MNAEPETAAARLCAACGMCCDGVLFHAVVLQPGDSRRAIAALGLKVKRDGDGRFFRQPCAAHQRSSCVIYDERPERCRAFACRQLREMTAGETSEEAAFARVGAARREVARVRALMDRIVETNPRRALAQRYANAMTDAPPDAAPVRAELEAAMNALEQRLERDFRVD